MMPTLFLVAGAVALVVVAFVVRRRQREAEEQAERALTRLRRRQAALTDRYAEIGLEVASLARPRSAPPPAQP